MSIVDQTQSEQCPPTSLAWISQCAAEIRNFDKIKLIGPNL